MRQILEGIKVLDLSQFLSGPRCTQLLADFGAEVVKLEPPLGEGMRWLMSPVQGLDRSMSNWNRNKKGITLDIRHPKGKEIFLQLVKHFDILVENLAPGTLEKLGLGYDDLSKLNPALIFCSITGFGHTGQNSERVAFDVIAQATSGILSAMGIPDRVHPVFFGDLVSGAYGAYGILLALIDRQKSGKGQMIDISMQDVLYFHNFLALDRRSIDVEDLKESLAKAVDGTFSDFFTGARSVPFWSIYQAQDGNIAVVFLTDAQWRRICKIIGKPEMADDQRFANVILRTRNRELYRADISEWMKKHKVEEIEKILVENRIPCGRVMKTDEVNQDPHLKERGMLAFCDDPVYGKIATPGIPIQMSQSPGEIKRSAPRLGEHNFEIYNRYLGLTENELAELKKQGVI